jgi:hypothetical protein
MTASDTVGVRVGVPPVRASLKSARAVPPSLTRTLIVASVVRRYPAGAVTLTV